LIGGLQNLFLCADGDKEGSPARKAIEKALWDFTARLAEEKPQECGGLHIEAKIPPEGKDFNDLLMGADQ